MGGARGGQGGEVEQHVALQDGRWEEVLNQLPQEAAAQLRDTGHGESLLSASPTDLGHSTAIIVSAGTPCMSQAVFLT